MMIARTKVYAQKTRNPLINHSTIHSIFLLELYLRLGFSSHISLWVSYKCLYSPEVFHVFHSFVHRLRF